LRLDSLAPGSVPDDQDDGADCQRDDGDPKKKKPDFFGAEGRSFMLHDVLWDAGPAQPGRFFG
jgi:hypothetical protein